MEGRGTEFGSWLKATPPVKPREQKQKDPKEIRGFSDSRSDDEGEYGSNQMGKVQKETQLEEAGPQRRIKPFLSTGEDLMMVTTFGSTVSRAGPYGGPW